jgi:hypothetical protein
LLGTSHVVDGMEIRVFPSNADLPDHLRWQIISIIRMEWHETAGDYTGPQALPGAWHPSHVAGTEGDALVSYAGVVWRDIEHAGQIFRTYGLSSVFTFPALRRRGFAGRIVQCATSRIRHAADGDIAVLFTMDGMEPFYETQWVAGHAVHRISDRRSSIARAAQCCGDDAVRVGEREPSSLRVRARSRLLRRGPLVKAPPRRTAARPRSSTGAPDGLEAALAIPQDHLAPRGGLTPGRQS